MGLPYKEERAMDDMLRGRGESGTQWWLRLDGPPKLVQHKTEVPACVGLLNVDGSITPIYTDKLSVFPSALAPSMDALLIEQDYTPRKTWLLVQVDESGSRGGRRISLLDRRDPVLPSSDGMHPPPTPTAQGPGPVSPGSPAPVSSLPEQGANPFCGSCGKETRGKMFCPHCGVAQ